MKSPKQWRIINPSAREVPLLPEVKERPVGPVAKIHGGVRVPHYKAAAELATEDFPTPSAVVIPMRQHIGAPCRPTVKKGDRVYAGSLIGESEQTVSAPIHSGVSGTVREVRPFRMTSGETCDAVVIDSDGADTPDPALAPPTVTNAEELAAAARASGLVGLGGAGFPAHIKLRPKQGVKLDTLIVNAAECEPFITADYREIMESTDDILNAVYLIKELMNIDRVFIAVENNKPKAFDALLSVAADRRDSDDTVKVMKLKSRYPQGAEKVLIYSATGRRLAPGQLPADAGCLVMNVTSVAFLYRYIKTGMPLTHKRVTVEGDCIAAPHNLRVPIGTAISDIVEYCGGYTAPPRKILYGGPMMGIAVAGEDSPILKYNNAVLFLGKRWREPPERPCIRCGRCAAACPMSLLPMEIQHAVAAKDAGSLAELGVAQCLECGCCAYVCPSKRELTQTMRLAKSILKNAK